MAKPIWNTYFDLSSQPAGSTVEIRLICSPILPATSITYSLQNGTLPTGLTLSSQGILSGVLSQVITSTTFTFTVMATDNLGNSSSQTFVFKTTYAPSQPVWVTPAGSIGSYPYGVAVTFAFFATASSPATSVTYTLISGTLPDGLTFTNGIILGTPTLVTNETVKALVVRATDNLGNVTDRTFSITISGSAAPSFITPSGTLITTNDSVWIQLPVEYANPVFDNPIIFKISQGILPPGLEINQEGLIRGYAEPPKVNVTLPSVATTVTSTSEDDILTCLSTTGFAIGRPITFSGSPIFGGVDSGVTYYIKTIINATSFTISSTQNGDTFNLTAGSGFMVATLRPTDVNEPTIRTYSFNLTIESPLGMASRAFSITVVNQNTPASQGGPGRPASTRIPTIYNTRPATFNLNDTDPYYGYYVLPPASLGYNDTYPPSVAAFIGTIKSDNYFTFKIIGQDFDGDQIGYSFSELPYFLTGDSNTGWIEGTPQLGTANINQFNFSVVVYKTINPAVRTAIFNFSFNVSNEITGNITWVTPNNLGSIFNGALSTKAVLATSDVELEYRLVDGSLPPNLSLLSNGEITGYTAFQPTDQVLNLGDETLFTFSIEAYSPKYPIVTSTKEFTITVTQQFDQPTDTLYIKCAPDINDRNIIEQLLTNTSIFPENMLYRPNDAYFGLATDVIYEHAYGIHASMIEEYLAAVTRNHYWRYLTLGQLKTAIAKNEAGEIIYEVVYSEVIDNLINPSGISISSQIEWPRTINLNQGPWYTSVTNLYTSYVFNTNTIDFTTTVTGTTAGTNILTCTSTSGLVEGQRVTFTGTLFGGINALTTYYVNSVDSNTTFTVREDNGTGAATLTTDSGSMTINQYSPEFFTSLTPGSANTLYPNSLPNMRNRVGAVLGQEYDSKLLPLWMTSQQINGSTLGYTPAWVVCYTKPRILVDGNAYTYQEFEETGLDRATYKSYAETIINNMNNLWTDPIGRPYKLNQINFQIDRFSVNKELTYNYDNYVSPAAWTGLPSGTPVPNPLDSKDFYVLFPRKTILPDETQY